MPERAPADVLVSLNEVRLAFRLNLYRSWSMKDFFSGVSRRLNRQLDGGVREIQVADQVKLDVRRGDRIALLGRNGAGKTSLCRLIAGIYRPDQGEIIRHCQVRAVLDASIGIQPELTGRENIALLSRFLFPETEDRDELIDEVLDWSGLGEFSDAPVRVYSKGMMTRLVLSLVSSRPSECLILDEVFDGADRFFSEKTIPRFLKMIESSGSVIFVSHDAEQIRLVCNRAVVLEHGQLIFDGAVDEGLRRYEALG